MVRLVCPRGSFYDVLGKMISPGRRIPAFIRQRPARVGLLAFLMAFLTFQIVIRWPDFVSIGRFFVILLTVTTSAGVVLALLFHQRTWCYLCPIGTMQKWVGEVKSLFLSIRKSAWSAEPARRSARCN